MLLVSVVIHFSVVADKCMFHCWLTNSMFMLTFMEDNVERTMKARRPTGRTLCCKYTVLKQSLEVSIKNRRTFVTFWLCFEFSATWRDAGLLLQHICKHFNDMRAAFGLAFYRITVLKSVSASLDWKAGLKWEVIDVRLKERRHYQHGTFSLHTHTTDKLKALTSIHSYNQNWQFC